MRQLIGTGLITLTNILDGQVEVWYSPSPDIKFTIDNEKRLGEIDAPGWHAAPSKQGDIYMIQRVGGKDEPWGPVVRMEGVAGISYRMRGTWRPGVEYIGACEYELNNPGKPVSPVVLKGSIDLVIYQGSTYACMETHMSDPASIDQTPPSKNDVMEAQKIDPMPEVKTRYWVLTSMLGMQGPDGAAGPAGPGGKPSINLILSNENHSFTANEDGIITQENLSTSTQVQVYVGTDLVPVEDAGIFLPTTTPPGLELKWDTNDKSILVIKALTGGDLSDNGSFKITARVKYGTENDTQIAVVSKDFSWVKVRNATSPYSITIYSTKGNIFEKGTVDTTLKATIMHGESDVSEQMKDKVVWYKVTPSEDVEWAKGVLEIDIDSSQVYGQGVFACEVEV